MSIRRVPNNPGTPFCKALVRRVSFGSLVALHLPNGLEPVPEGTMEALHREERVFASGLRGRRQIEWVGGRLALRGAAATLGIDLGPVLPGARGEPLLPKGLTASISHKRGVAAALIGQEGEGTVGLDIEELAPERMAIARRVLVPVEMEAMEGLPIDRRWRSLVERFALKEATYKAIHPHVERYVGFDEAMVEGEGGRIVVRLELALGEGPFSVEAELFEEGAHIWAMVRARRRG